MKGILIVNTGSPKTCDKSDVKHFIGEMLSDPLVMDVPDYFRNILAKWIIAPLRGSASAAKYSLIWNKEKNESPLLHNTTLFAKELEKLTGMPVEIAMRYCDPSIPEAFKRLKAKCATLHEVVIVPMFPQYARSSYQTAIDAVAQYFYHKPHSFRLKVIEPIYNNINYIHALASSLKPYITNEYDCLVFCFHSLPLNHVEAGWEKGKDFDYVYQIKETIRLVTKELDLDPQKNRILYSSAMGSNWLKPTMEEAMEEFPKNGKKNVIVITPGFAADNLETLYDITILAKEIFIKAGGEKFTYVPCLNASGQWVEAMARIIAGKS